MALLAWCVALMMPAGVGYALWSASGAGPGEARATTAQSLTVVAGSATADLYPGASGDVVFSVTNPNIYPVQVTGATVASVTNVSGAGCAASDFTLGTGSVTPTTINSTQTATVRLTGAITMKTTAPDACQGATVTVTGTVTGSSA